MSEVYDMAISYNKLWKLLIDKKMNKTMLRQEAHLSATTVAKMGKDKPVAMESMLKICKVLNCDIGDIVEAIPDASEKEG
jgi:DNA-binding Xre family transcriptional regulator